MKWNQFVQDDAFNILPKIDNESVDLTFTSLPDISQGPWGSNIKDYQEFQNKSCDEMARITKSNSLFRLFVLSVIICLICCHLYIDVHIIHQCFLCASCVCIVVFGACDTRKVLLCFLYFTD